jgi:hypothetical protein
VTLALLAQLALGHGGAPTTSEVVWAPDGSATLVTSHGTIAEDLGWAWVCEEVVGEDALSTGLARTSERWVMATTAGLIQSDTGCDWQSTDGPTGLTRGVVRDRSDDSVLWTADAAGLWRSDGGAFALEEAADLDIRDFAQLSDGRFALVGFDGDVPTMQLPSGLHALPTEYGSLSIAEIDSSDRVYVIATAGALSSLIRVDAEGAEVLLEATDNLADVTERDGQLYTVVYLLGTRWSSDDGATWADPAGARLECIEPSGAGVYGCPADGGLTALSFTLASDPDPASWAWTTELQFAEVIPATCGEADTFAAACEPLWEVVAGEFGIELDVEPEPSGCGCRTSSHGAAWAWCLWPVLRRRRHS